MSVASHIHEQGTDTFIPMPFVMFPHPKLPPRRQAFMRACSVIEHNYPSRYGVTICYLPLLSRTAQTFWIAE